MKVGPIVVGALIGGAVWVFALRATSAAARDTVGSPSDSPPPPDMGGVITDGQGSVVGTVAQTPPAIAPGDGCPTTTSDMKDMAKDATSQTVISANTTAAGVDGTTGSALPLKTDPINGTVTIDHMHPLGGQGVDQMAATSAGQSPPIIAPSYADAMPMYTDYLVARYGSLNGLTSQQVNDVLREAAQVGGLPL